MTLPPPPRRTDPRTALRPGLLIIFESTQEWCVLLERDDLMGHINDWSCTSTGELVENTWSEGPDDAHTWVWNCLWGSDPGPAHYASRGDMGYGICESSLHSILSTTGSWTLAGDTLTVHAWSLIDNYEWNRFSR